MNNNILKLKNTFTSQEIKNKLPESGGLGFLFHITDWQTLNYVLEKPIKRDRPSEEFLWNMGRQDHISSITYSFQYQLLEQFD